MRMLTTVIAAIAALFDWLFSVVRSAFTNPDPSADLDAEAASARAEAAAIEATDDSPVAVARRFLAGDNAGYSRLPRRAMAWLVCAAEAGLVVEEASDRDLGAWLSGASEHPQVPPSWVAAVMRGEHPTPPARVNSTDAGWSPMPAPAF